MPVQLKRPKRPNHGPYYQSYWSPSRKKWVMRMTDEGRAMFDKIMSDYDGDPIRSISTKYRGLYRVATRGINRERAFHAAIVGVVQAIRCWKPGFETDVKTLLLSHVVQCVQIELFGDRNRGTSVIATSASGDGDTDGDEFLLARAVAAPEADDSRADADDLQRLHNLLRHLPPRSQAILLAKFSGQTLDSIAREYGVVRERVRQIVSSSINKLRRLAGQPEGHVTTKTTLPPTPKAHVLRELVRQRMEAVKTLLEQHPHGLTAYEISQELNMAQSKVRNILNAGAKAQKPIFRYVGDRQRFSKNPVHWFVVEGADQDQAG